jgi:hypothetical protein
MIQRAAFFGHHQHRAVGVAAGDGGHHAGIHDAQTGHAVHAQTAVHYRHRVVGAAHFRRADRMEDGAGDVASQARQFLIRLELHAGPELFGLVFRQGRLGNDLAGQAQAVGGDFAVFVSAEVVGRNGRRVLEAGRSDLHRAAAGGVQVADAGGEGRKRVQRLAEGIQAQRLDVIFDVGVGPVRRAAREGAELLGAMLIGPLCLSAYSRPIFALPQSELASVLSVCTPCTLNTARICR